MVAGRLFATLMLTAMAAGAAQAQEFRLSSASMSEGVPLSSSQVFDGFGCKGGNVSPQLSWSGAPKGTRSFAITLYDPDAPTGSGWWHWTVVNIPASATALESGASGGRALPTGAVETTNDYGTAGFGGACPPPGAMHRYVVTVHALATERLTLPEKASNALVGFMIGANTIAKAQLTAVYTR
ncbi:YbhB/YbcL family Raf kinase inhibitor-like protein [Methylobacterium oryzihabitans]|uniref:YbhB/YbcL family Raf kinase inhibitor-like protein n=1 Tax=Methylobacterium oryzihabitans TaxID=2499852 RepID=A0A3S2VNR4_9HYPH|nr:YbhB/YbcL family Raf kinase inhibitor-like protein [Methylobacterium oryzihabitans]RVU17115.1 YbhB/YbcL family Raf kinase inhibitor-like protein [Methylobacterium oryzihabitans]